MSLDRLKAAFRDACEMPEENIHDALQYNTVRQWDSVGHMALVAELEGRFDIMLDTDEILGMSSFAKAREILKNHGIDCDA